MIGRKVQIKNNQQRAQLSTYASLARPAVGKQLQAAAVQAVRELAAAPPAPTQRADVHHQHAVGVCPSGSKLAHWVQDMGGYIHPALAVVESTPLCKCRGVIATSPISDQELSDAPLIAVPERLYMTSKQARDLLAACPALSQTSTSEPKSPIARIASFLTDKNVAQTFQLPAVTQLALLLAHENKKGQNSFWQPYIAALPEQPPVAWLMSDSQLQTELRQLSQGMNIDVAAWKMAVSDAQKRIHMTAKQAAAQYGSELGVNTDDVIWATAQVVSRAFGTGNDVGLAPFIDLCNHQQGAASPACWMDEQRGGEPVAYITSPAPLEAGQELFVSYLTGCTPLTAFLNFGFVPPELMFEGRAV